MFFCVCVACHIVTPVQGTFVCGVVRQRVEWAESSLRASLPRSSCVSDLLHSMIKKGQ